MFARIDARPRHRNSGRPAEKSAPGFLKWLRGRPCHLAGKGAVSCSGHVRACHVDHGGDKGTGTKVSDRFAMPMCDGHHEYQHKIGWRPFERAFGFDALAIAAAFWAAWPGRVAWERERAA